MRSSLLFLVLGYVLESQAADNQASQKALMDCVAKFHQQSITWLSTDHVLLNESDPTQPILLVPSNDRDAKGMMTGFRVYTPSNAFQYTLPAPSKESDHADFRDRKNHFQFRIEDPNLSITQNGRQSFFVSTYEQRKLDGSMISTDIDTATSNATRPLSPNEVHRLAPGGTSNMSSQSTQELRDFLLKSFSANVESANRQVSSALADEKNKTTDESFDSRKKWILETLHNWRASLPFCLQTGDTQLTAGINQMLDQLKSAELRLTHKVEANPRSLRQINQERYAHRESGRNY